VQRLLNGSIRDWVGFADDPADFPATQGFTFHGGTHILIAPSPGSVFAMQSLAVIGTSNVADAQSMRAHVARLVHFCCQVSNRIAVRAGLQRNMAVPGERELRVPPEDGVRQLQDAVTFSAGEWQSILRARRLEGADIAPLVAVAKPARVDELPYHSGALGERPFLQVGDAIVAFAPHRIADALVHHVRGLMAGDEAREPLAEHYHGLLQTSVTSSVEHLGWRQILQWKGCGSAPTGTLLSEAVFQWDHNRLAHVVVMSDGCEKGTKAWIPEGVAPSLASAWAGFDRICHGTTPYVAERVLLLVMAPISGAESVSMKNDGICPEDLLVIPAWDMQAVSEGINDIAPSAFLGRYSRARRALRQTGCQVQAWSELDVIASWLEQDCRFPAGMNYIGVDCDFSRSIRERALRTHDWHSAASSTNGMLVEIGVAESPELPIFGPRYVDPTFLKIVVELSGRFVWFEMQRPRRADMVDWPWAVQFVRMCAYWTAEILEPLPRDHREPARVVVVEVEPLSESDDTPSGGGYIISPGYPCRLSIIIHPSFTSTYGATNATERAFAGHLAHAVIDVLGEEHPGLVDTRLAHCAPVGPKRMMHAVDSARVPEYSFLGDLPQNVCVHRADVAQIEATLLANVSLSIPEAGLEGSNAQAWLNRAVQVLFTQLRAEVSKYSGRALLLRLMLNAEALLLKLTEEELTLASQLACFARSPDLVERLRKDGPRRAAAAMATRFLVELVACEPPSGSALPGDVDVAYMLALGLQIIGFGAASDIVHYELGSVAVRNGSGRLQVFSGQFEEANQVVREAAFSEQLSRERARRSISRLTPPAERKPQDALGEKLSNGVLAEFNVTLEQLGSFFADCVSLSQERHEAVVVISEGDFATHVANRSGLVVNVPNPRHSGDCRLMVISAATG
jgi:hypothetical protein